VNETIRLRSGTLRLTVESAEMPLYDLCGFASRRSRKRRFVFVSKVLGKHYPVRPHEMAATHAALATKIASVPGPIVLIALAETATGLGQGIFEQLRRFTGRDDLLFLHTTRYRLHRPLALEFVEPHSHAPDHLLYDPDDPLFHSARSLILVDDEITTGRTLMNLAAAYQRLNPSLNSVHFVCLTDWLGAKLSESIQVHSLLRGTFDFEPDLAFNPGDAPSVVGRGDFKDELLAANHGRLGVRTPREYDLDAIITNLASHRACSGGLLVLGSGEFAHPPYLLARRLEELGHEVYFQSMTRSPLLVDGDLTSALEFTDNYGDGMPNYLYNVADRRYDRVLIGYETRPLPPEHNLPALLGASVVYF
jgi:hypothetical protein